MKMHDVRPAVGEVDAIFLPWCAWSRGRSIHTSGQQLNSIATCLNLRFGDARYDAPKGRGRPVHSKYRKHVMWRSHGQFRLPSFCLWMTTGGDMDNQHNALIYLPAFRKRLLRPTTRLLIWLVSLLLGLSLAGCSVMWVSNYDKESVDRTTEISKAVIKFYQDLLATDVKSRPAAIAGPFGKREGDVASIMRLHVLREEGRSKNAEGALVARNLVLSWEKFSTSHASADKTALSDSTLIAERGILERHLRSGFRAEEAKKMSASADSSSSK